MCLRVSGAVAPSAPGLFRSQAAYTGLSHIVVSNDPSNILNPATQQGQSFDSGGTLFAHAARMSADGALRPICHSPSPNPSGRMTHRHRSLTSIPPDFNDVSDGSSHEEQRECGAGALFQSRPNAAAAPATVSGESFVIGHWDTRTWEGDARYRPASQETCRQLVVTREDVGRGLQTSESSFAKSRAKPRSL